MQVSLSHEISADECVTWIRKAILRHKGFTITFSAVLDVETLQ
jgi:hypothetical protein